MPHSSDSRQAVFGPDFFGWTDRQGQSAQMPQAWCSGWLELKLPTSQWENLRLEVDGVNLPLLLSRSGKNHQILAQWPALGAGFCEVQLSDQQKRLAAAKVFIGTHHLNQTQWLALLAELRYRLPARLLLRSQTIPGGKVPVKLTDLPHDLNEEMALYRQWLTGTHHNPGLWAALEWLARNARRTPALSGHWQALSRSRRPDRHQLLKSQLSPQSPVWEQGYSAGTDTPENRFVAGVVKTLREHLHQLSAYARRSGEFVAASELEQSKRQLERLWLRHPLAGLQPQFSLPANLHTLRLPAYIVCVQLQRALQKGWLPQTTGPYELPYADLAMLYQHYCLLRVVEALLAWGEQQGWQVEALQLDLHRGSRLLCLSQAGCELALYSETSYTQSGPLISLSRSQRPDISLTVHHSGQLSQLIVMEAKYRSDEGRPLKEDLDKLHTYRDAIRNKEGKSVVQHAVLLYPGLNKNYRPGLSAWQILPDCPENLPMAQLLKACGV